MLLAGFCALLALAAPAAAKNPPPDQTSPLPNVTGCDAIDASACMLPFPNDLYTKADSTSATGRRIDFSLLAMPRNAAGKPIDPTDQNRSDGFSPGSEIVTKITGLDTDAQLDAIGAARLWNPEGSLLAGAPIAVIDADTGAKHMVWAELDHSMDALGAAPADRDLVIRPSKNFLEGHRYIVALRLGDKVTTDPTFAAYRDKTTLANPLDEQRRAHFEHLFTTLAAAGIERGDLTQAWDFTIASGDNIAGRMLAIRNDAFHQLGDDNLGDLKVEGKAPAFTLTRVTNIGCAQGIDPPDPPIGDTSLPGRQGRPDRLRRQGHDGRPVLSVDARLRAGALALRPEPHDEPAGADPRQRHEGRLPLPDPAGGARQPGCRPALALRPRPVRQHRRGRPGPAEEHDGRAQLRLLRDGVGGHGHRGRPERRDGPARRCRASTRSPTASSRGCSTSSTSAA